MCIRDRITPLSVSKWMFKKTFHVALNLFRYGFVFFLFIFIWYVQDLDLILSLLICILLLAFSHVGTYLLYDYLDKRFNKKAKIEKPIKPDAKEIYLATQEENFKLLNTLIKLRKENVRRENNEAN
ncbi:hypothetical protein, partial [Pseudomonas syringae group genomosp. 3]|uniref:hypothetical protein n=1 Tax=Pseudomonas syringae group genomosp. 3 TaxID=251701 RepID=UPI001C801F4A